MPGARDQGGSSAQTAPGRWRQALLALQARHHRAVLAAAGLILLAVTTIWFFRAEDDQGKTARLQADAPYYHAYLPSLVLDRDLDFDDEYEITGNWYRLGKTPIDRRSNVFGIGPAVYTLPFFLFGHALAQAAGSQADGFSEPEILASLYASLLYSLGALFFAYRLLRRRLGGAYLPALVPLLVACSGPVVYYAIRQPGYSHPFATFWVAWLVDYVDASFDPAPGPRPLRTWLGMGALIGAAALARPQLALWAALALLAAADDVRRVLGLGARGSGGRWRALAGLAPRWAAGAALSLLIFSPQLLAWKSLYGAYLAVPQGEGFMRWDAPAWSEVLMSSRNGLLPWAPLYALAGLGLILSVRRHPRLGGALLLGVALQTVANGAAWDWWAGGSFGGRRFDSCFVAFAFGLGYLLIRLPRAAEGWIGRCLRMAWIAAVLALSMALAAANVGLASIHSGPTVRIHGGRVPAELLEEEIGGHLGRVVAAASRAANLPARLVFAWRYGAARDDYDRVVGVHHLGELFPGLNSFRGKRTHRFKLDPASPAIAGLVRAIDAGPADAVALAGARARILVGLNRIGPVRFNVQAAASGTEAVPLVLRLNGALLAEASVGPDTTQVAGTAPAVRRGINVLEIEAPPGTRLYRLTLSSPVAAHGR